MLLVPQAPHRCFTASSGTQLLEHHCWMLRVVASGSESQSSSSTVIRVTLGSSELISFSVTFTCCPGGNTGGTNVGDILNGDNLTSWYGLSLVHGMLRNRWGIHVEVGTLVVVVVVVALVVVV
ncbi:hypothetical protein E2C01_004830 [Portunus trituberculatus]|uniref:Uncharacterized protein n=1 Tax=Portunus trituberculatus TaxID=210409 RepID=A0A5B7CR19_PORTR|nr:hypothetical protein [Portunus trituberculatus]